jgi:hypothetical protein
MALASRASASIPLTSGSPVKGPETTGQASSVSNAHQNGSQHKGVMNKNAPQNGGEDIRTQNEIYRQFTVFASAIRRQTPDHEARGTSGRNAFAKPVVRQRRILLGAG